MAQTRTIGAISIDNGTLHWEFTNGDGQDVSADADAFSADVSQAEIDQCAVQFTNRLKAEYVRAKAQMLEDGTYSEAALASRLSIDFVGKELTVDYFNSPIVNLQ